MWTAGHLETWTKGWEIRGRKRQSRKGTVLEASTISRREEPKLLVETLKASGGVATHGGFEYRELKTSDDIEHYLMAF